MTLSNFVPRENDNGQTLGTPQKQWSNVYANDLTLNGESLNNKLQNMQINITPQMFGAKGDNTGDDSAALNAFFAYDTKVPKIVPKGTYRITNTLRIPGYWRDADSDYGFYNIKFEDAQINYQGAVGDCSVLIYNHFRSHISGLSVSKYSKANFVQVTGCWHCQFEDWGIYSDLWLNGNTNGKLIGPGQNNSEIATVSIMHLLFINMWMLGAIRCNKGTGYINSIKFDKSHIRGDGSTIQYGVIFTGATSYQNIVFDNSDLSYYTKAIVKVNDTIENGSLTFRSVYFDTAIPIVEDNNGLYIVYDNCYFSANNIPVIITNQSSFEDTDLISSECDAPIVKHRYSNNLIPNGNFNSTIFADVVSSYNTNIVLAFGTTNTNATGRKLTITLPDGFSGNRNMYFKKKTCRANAPISFAVRGKKVQGTATLNIGVNNKYTVVDFSKYADGEEFVIALCPKRDRQYWGAAGVEPGLVWSFTSSSGNCVLDIYEIIVCSGTEVEFNMPCEP